jgi:prepilin-type N-terminal cleavage/methylation domain-containing protein
MTKRQGFSLIEIMIALAIAGVALVSFLTIFANNNDHAIGSRNRTVAILLAEGLMDDIESHTYGNPEPIRWTQETEDPVTVWVNGRDQRMEFSKSLTYDNGSFVGQGAESSDLVTITITWREGFGNDQVSGNDNKELVVQVPVWR